MNCKRTRLYVYIVGVAVGNQSLRIFGLKDIELAGNCSGVWARPGTIITLCHWPWRLAKYHFKFARDVGVFFFASSLSLSMGGGGGRRGWWWSIQGGCKAAKQRLDWVIERPFIFKQGRDTWFKNEISTAKYKKIERVYSEILRK